MRTFTRRAALTLGGAAAGAVLLGEISPAAAAVPVQRFYLGTYTSSGGKGIAKGRLDPATGRLTVDSWQAGIADASWLELSADRRFLYAVSEQVPNGLVSSLKLSAGGDPSPLNSKATGSAPVHLTIHPGGRYLVSSHYGGGAVAVHPILTDGSVGAATDVHTHPAGARAPRAHQVVSDPSGQYLLAVDLGLDAVIVYKLDTATGRLTETSRTAMTAGSGPRHLAFHPTRPVAYVANELDSTVTVCGWANGKLTPGQRVLSVPSPAGANYPGEILVSANGKFVYVSNRGQNTIGVFSVSANGAALKLVAAPSCGGDWPRHLALDASGSWIYAVNQRSGDVSWLPVNPATGIPGAVAGRLLTPAVAQLRLG
jgi:6-phosphogluconolactonase (cycloisomerase 2 family)